MKKACNMPRDEQPVGGDVVDRLWPQDYAGPGDLRLERWVLGAILCDEVELSTARGMLRLSCFAHAHHMWMWENMTEVLAHRGWDERTQFLRDQCITDPAEFFWGRVSYAMTFRDAVDDLVEFAKRRAVLSRAERACALMRTGFCTAGEFLDIIAGR